MSTRDPLNPTVIVGAGAAGLMAALHAAAGARPVWLLDGRARPGQKILISGGGRCNILPARVAHTDFISDGSPNQVRKILAAWPQAEIRRFFEADLGLPLKLEPETGKFFPASDRSQTVLDALLTAVNHRGVQLRLGVRVQAVARAGDAWTVRLENDESIRADRVILATGGLSVPATGSDGAGLRIAGELGHTIVPTYPALAPLTGGSAAHRALAGVSLTATVWAEAAGTLSMPAASAAAPRAGAGRGGFLFTHRGYSGPAVLNISHAAARPIAQGGSRPTIRVQWADLDADAWEAALREGRGGALSLLRQHLPERLAAQLLVETGLEGADLSQLRREERSRLVEILTRYPLPWTGTEGYKTAEVTGGGVSLAEVNPATLESRRAPDLYFCGEMLDAFGPIGGYNFLWAWVTGRIAGVASAGR